MLIRSRLHFCCATSQLTKWHWLFSFSIHFICRNLPLRNSKNRMWRIVMEVKFICLCVYVRMRVSEESRSLLVSFFSLFFLSTRENEGKSRARSTNGRWRCAVLIAFTAREVLVRVERREKRDSSSSSSSLSSSALARLKHYLLTSRISFASAIGTI